MARTTGIFLLAALAGSACVTGRSAPPPPMDTYTLGMWRASYRNYAESRVSICSAEPRWLLDQLSSVNGVLNNWLGATSRSHEERWTREELSLLDDGVKTLPTVVDVHAQNLKDVADCGFANENGWPDLRERGAELVARARERIALAPKLTTYFAERDAYALWKSERSTWRADARRTCPEKPPRRGPPPIYYAQETEAGEVRWFFCDGARVVAGASGGQPVFEPPPDLSARQRRRLQPKSYLNAAFDFPEGRVDRPLSPPTWEGVTSAER